MIIEINPVGTICNLRCAYCNAQFLRKRHNQTGLISKELIVEIYEKIKALDLKEINIHWYGGEPLLAGLDFYKWAIDLQKESLPQISVINSTNCNGLLLNRDFLNFFRETGFIFSVSLDGINYEQNRFRFQNKKDYSRLLKKLDLIREMDHAPTIQMVVHLLNYDRSREIFDYLNEKLHIHRLALCPCFHRNPGGGISDMCLGAEEYAQFLIGLYDSWAAHNAPFRVNLFRNLHSIRKTEKNNLCYLAGNCSSMNIDNRGNVYTSCEVQNEKTFLGHIKDGNLSDLYKMHCARSKGLRDDELATLMKSRAFQIVRKPEKICYQYGHLDSYYYLKSIWSLYQHVFNNAG